MFTFAWSGKVSKKPNVVSRAQERLPVLCARYDFPGRSWFPKALANYSRDELPLPGLRQVLLKAQAWCFETTNMDRSRQASVRKGDGVDQQTQQAHNTMHWTWNHSVSPQTQPQLGRSSKRKGEDGREIGERPLETGERLLKTGVELKKNGIWMVGRQG